MRIFVTDKRFSCSVCLDRIVFIVRRFPVIEEIVREPWALFIIVEPSRRAAKLGEGLKSLKNILDVSTAFDALKRVVLTVDGTVIDVPINSIVLLLRTDCCALNVILLIMLMAFAKASSHVMLRADMKFPVDTELVNDTGPMKLAEV
jgi:hypothetical protein